jgi:hypothetical protein
MDKLIIILTKTIEICIKTMFNDPPSFIALQYIIKYLLYLMKHDGLNFLINKINFLENILH